MITTMLLLFAMFCFAYSGYMAHEDKPGFAVFGFGMGLINTANYLAHKIAEAGAL